MVGFRDQAAPRVFTSKAKRLNVCSTAAFVDKIKKKPYTMPQLGRDLASSSQGLMSSPCFFKQCPGLQKSKSTFFIHLVNQHNFRMVSITVRPWHLHSWLFFQVKALGFNHVPPCSASMHQTCEFMSPDSATSPKDSEDPIDGSDKLKMAHHLPGPVEEVSQNYQIY